MKHIIIAFVFGATAVMLNGCASTTGNGAGASSSSFLMSAGNWINPGTAAAPGYVSIKNQEAESGTLRGYIRVDGNNGI